jgi:hypothetical protein
LIWHAALVRTELAMVVSHKLLCVGLLTGILSGCGPGNSGPAGEIPGSVRSEPLPRPESVSPGAGRITEPAWSRLTAFPSFQEVARELGVVFTYTNGAAGRSLMVEATGGGAGWLDYDGDGLLDLYLCQGGHPASESPGDEPSDQLYRQIEAGRFVSVTVGAAISERRYSQGLALADFDDDGFIDIYVTNVGPNTLLRNQGDGTFQDVSLAAGVANPLWSTSAAWGDLDGDGDLDLYVCNYVDYDPYHPILCGSNGRPGTCHPKNVDAVPDECYFNQGDGTFTAEAQARGIFGSDGKGLGVVIADLNNDGLPDIYVANDTTPNFLFVNQGRGQFVESANFLGCAVNREGLSQASMGVALGDYDQNGWLDLYCTNFTREANTLYKNLGRNGFQDVTGLVGLYTPTLNNLGFGTVMCDFNLDGHEDIFVTNGHVDDWREKGDDYEMKPSLFSCEAPRFVDCSEKAGAYFASRVIGRGVACGDFDNDGDWDLAVVHQNAPVAILLNDSDRGNWLKVRCRAIGNRFGMGTRVTLSQGARTLTQELAGGVSYCSAHEAALIFGLGSDASPVDLEVRWPDGSRQNITAQPVNHELVVRQLSSATAPEQVSDRAASRLSRRTASR